MASLISRFFDFEPGTTISSSQVDSELNQLLTSINNINTYLSSATDGSSGADNIGITAITDISASTLLQTFLEDLVSRLEATTDSLSGADLIGITGIADLDSSLTTVQSFCEGIISRLNSTTDTESGADYIKMTSIADWGGASVQAMLELLAASIGNRTYSLNTVVVDGQTITESIDRLDSGLTENAAVININIGNISENSEAIEALTLVFSEAFGSGVFTEHNYIVSGDTITNNLDALDMKLKDEADKIATAEDTLSTHETEINSLEITVGNNTETINEHSLSIGSPIYTEQNFVSNSNNLPTNIDALDLVVKDNLDNIATNVANILLNTTHRGVTTGNPHNVTASDLAVYTKVELQGDGTATVHWNNLTNVPNFADSSWKAPVTLRTGLPLTSNTVGDVRMVGNDGDGKPAYYVCIATTGDIDNQWEKFADIDYSIDHTHEQYYNIDGSKTLTGNMNLGGYKLLTAGAESLSSAPTENVFEGRMYYDTSAKKFRVYNGTAWFDSGSLEIDDSSISDAKLSDTAGQIKSRVSTNTSNIATNVTAISLNTAKRSYPTADENKIANISVTQAVDLDAMESDIEANNNKVGITTTQASNIVTNNAKVGITSTQASNITANNAKISYTDSSAVALNTAKVGITTTQANAITTNTAKVGITTTQASNITTNNAKISYTAAAAVALNTAKKVPIVKTGKTLLSSSWSTSSNDYAYYKDYSDSDVASTDMVQVALDVDSQDIAVAAGLSNTCQSYTGLIRFYCNTIPTANILFDYVIVKG